MKELLTFCFLAALAVNFVYASTDEGMIFSFVRRRLYKLPLWIKKPLYSCVICMSFWWGVLFYYLAFGKIELNTILCVFAVGGINFLFTRIIPYEL